MVAICLGLSVLYDHIRYKDGHTPMVKDMQISTQKRTSVSYAAVDK